MLIEIKNNRAKVTGFKDQPYFPIFRNAIFMHAYLEAFESNKGINNYLYTTKFLDNLSAVMPCDECAEHILQFKNLVKPTLTISQQWFWGQLKMFHKYAKGERHKNDSRQTWRKSIKEKFVQPNKNNYYNPFVLAFLETLRYYDTSEPKIKLIMDFFAIHSNDRPERYSWYMEYLLRYKEIVWKVDTIISKEQYEYIYIK
jgi:hypothetical protein